MKVFIIVLTLLMLNLVCWSQPYIQKQKIVDANRDNVDGYGFSLDILGDYAITSLVGDEEDLNELNPLDSAGAVLIYNRLPNGNWIMTQKITPADRHDEAAYGVRVELYDDEAFVSSPGQDLDSLGGGFISGAGAVYVYSRVAGQYVETQKLVAPDRSGGEDFGTGLAVWGDWMAVGATGEEYNVDGTLGPAGGSVYMFKKNNNTSRWDYSHKVEAPIRRAGDFYGCDVAIHNGVMVVAARRQDYDEFELNFISNAGAAYVYRLSGNNWVFEQKLIHPSRTSGDNLGFSVDVNNDRIVLSAPERPVNIAQTLGSVYFFDYSGSSWNLQQSIVSPNASVPFNNSLYGVGLELKPNKLFVGAPGDSNPFGTGLIASGSVFEYDLTGSSYTFVNEILPAQQNSIGVFGVSISADDNKLFIGASGEKLDENDQPPAVDTAGAAYIFEQCIHSNIPQVNILASSICVGDSVQLVISSSSDLNSAKEWYWYTGTYGSGVLVDSTDTIWVSPSVTTTYTVAGEGYCVNAQDSDSTQTITITVNSLPIVTANALPTTTLCAGESVTLTGGGANTYVWDNSVSDGVGFTPSATNTYKVVGTDANGCVDSTTINITVSAGLTAGINYTGSTTICSGTQVTLSGTGATTYSWNNGVNDGVAFTPLVTNTYTVTGSSPSGCSDTEDITITVIAGPSVTASSGITTICEGASVSLSALGADSYSWDNSLGAGQSHTVSPTVTTTYTVTGTQSATMCTDTDMITITVNSAPNIIANALPNDSLCLGESLTLTGSGGAAYTWNQGVVDGIVFTPTLGSIDYIVTGTDVSGCVGKDTVNVKVFSQPVISASASASGPICSGSQVILNGFGGVTYTWDSSGVNVGIVDNVPFFPPVGNNIVYTVTGVDANGCSGTAIQSISVNESPSVTAFSSTGGASLCDGDSVQLTAIGNGQSYTWDNGVQDGVYFMPNVGTTLYTVTANSANGCTGQASVSVIVDPQDDATITPILPLCGGVPIQTLIAATSGGVWQGIGIDPVSGEFDASVSGQGVHEIVYTTSGTCGDSDTTYIEVYPELLVSVQEDSVCFGDVDGEIAVSANGVPPYNYLWDNDETTTSLSGLGEGIYNVSVKDSNNCIVDLSVNVYLTETCDYHLFIPNIFSPNNDLSNDVLYVRGKGFQALDFIVFDRWGNKMFESTDKEIGWDGSFNGTKVSSGVYVYYVEVEYYDGSKEILEGNVCVTF